MDPTPADQWKRCRAFSIQLALMPLLAGSDTCSQQFLVFVTGDQKSINRTLMVTRSLLCAT